SGGGARDVALLDEARNIFSVDLSVLVEDDHALNAVAQFANVSGPVVIVQELHGSWSDLGRLPALRLRELVEKGVDQEGQVLQPLAERRKLDGNPLEPVVEVIAEGALADHRAEI